MIQFLSLLREFAIAKSTTISVDNFIFRLHYKWTAIVLLLCSTLVCTYQLFGDPIYCTSQPGVPQKVINTYCWIENTYSLPKYWDGKVGSEVSYPGIGRYIKDKQMERRFHAYYQWVAFVLFLQAILFYAPCYFWKVREGRRLKAIIMQLNDPILDENTRKENRILLRDYLLATWSWNTSYAASYFSAEVFNLINIVCQIVLTDAFLGWSFTSYGSGLIAYANQKMTTSAMIKLFPLQTKCTFFKFGTGGSIQDFNCICILPLNVINQKIYLFLWFWFIILGVLSCIAVIFSVATMAVPSLRYIIIVVTKPTCSKASLEKVVNCADYGDWFLLYLLSININRIPFQELIDDLSERFDSGKYKKILNLRGTVEGIESSRPNPFYKNYSLPDLRYSMSNTKG